MGRPSLPPGIDSGRGIGWLVGNSLSLRRDAPLDRWSGCKAEAQEGLRRGPLLIGTKIVLQSAKPLAVTDGQVPGPQFFPIDRFIESRVSSRQCPLARRIEELLAVLEPGDRLLLSELSRLGRSPSEVIQIADTPVQHKIRFIAIKEGIEFAARQDLRTKGMIARFGLFADVERDLISERTREGLAAAKAKGKLPGRPKGALGTSRLDGKEQEIRVLRANNVSKASTAKITGVSRSALYPFIESRRIAPGLRQGSGRPDVVFQHQWGRYADYWPTDIPRPLSSPDHAPQETA